MSNSTPIRDVCQLSEEERCGLSNEIKKIDGEMLSVRRERLRSTSMPDVSDIDKTSQDEGITSVTSAVRPRPHSAEDFLNEDQLKVNTRSVKTLLDCVLGGEWSRAVKRVGNLEKNASEISQTNVNIYNDTLTPFHYFALHGQANSGCKEECEARKCPRILCREGLVIMVVRWMI